MATTDKGKSIGRRMMVDDFPPARQVGFDVVVEQVIASIALDYDGVGTNTAAEAAFTAIGKHVSENSELGSPFAGGVFRFSINGEVTTVAVNVD